MKTIFDYIIVGAGTAGCVLANRLSADPTNQVLLLEAGGGDNYLWIHIPVGYLYCIDNPRTDWRFRTETEAGLNGRHLIYPRGKVLGGCSSINGMIYMRGQREDYDSWEQQGNTGWGWDKVLPYFLKSEDYHGESSEFHAKGNELRVETQRLSWEILDAFRAAAAQEGIPPTDDFNCGNNFGCGYFEVNQRKGLRWNAASAFLQPIRHRPNLAIVTHAQVARLIFDHQKQCIGLEYFKKGQKYTAKAQVETILAAGALGSPQLLELSGIGDPSVLSAQNIMVHHSLIGVGTNLQDHLQLRMAFRVQGVPTLNEQFHSWLGKIRMGMQFVFSRKGPLTMAPSQLGCFAKSDPNQSRPNVEYHVQPLSLGKFGEPLHTFPAFTASVCNLHPTSRGTVHIQSDDFKIAPKIIPNYLATQEDKRVAADSLRLTRRIVSQVALSKYQPEEFMPGSQAQTEEELIYAAGQIGTTIFHPVGTCKMGPRTDPYAVVDHQLRVHGIQRLRVADASIMPMITSGNTNAPTAMIAEKAAELILLTRE